jgi:hypothetical protein
MVSPAFLHPFPLVPPSLAFLSFLWLLLRSPVGGRPVSLGFVRPRQGPLVFTTESQRAQRRFVRSVLFRTRTTSCLSFTSCVDRHPETKRLGCASERRCKSKDLTGVPSRSSSSTCLRVEPIAHAGFPRFSIARGASGQVLPFRPLLAPLRTGLISG